MQLNTGVFPRSRAHTHTHTYTHATEFCTQNAQQCLPSAKEEINLNSITQTISEVQHSGKDHELPYCHSSHPSTFLYTLNLFILVQNFALIQRGKVGPIAVVLLASKYQPHCDLYISWRIASRDKLLIISSALCTSYYPMRSVKLT